GGFAFALRDEEQQTLILGVDHFGIRRLYYTLTPEGIAFASCPSAVITAPRVERRVDLPAVFEYLNFGYVPSPRCIYARLRRLPPGHLLLVRNGKATLQRYFDITYSEQTTAQREVATALYHLIEEGIGKALHGIRAKEVGAFLSGGTDSSAIVGLMGR